MGSMAEDEILSSYGQTKRAIILFSSICYTLHIHEDTVAFLSVRGHKVCFQYLIVSRPSLAITLSVVSMELLSLHRIAEIRPSTWHRGGPGYEKTTFISVLFVS